jgi:2-polyprenyl-3-methyl-5-hydroxy-6-metoxy-1,4-benzoquinol methylase
MDPIGRLKGMRRSALAAQTGLRQHSPSFAPDVAASPFRREECTVGAAGTLGVVRGNLRMDDHLYISQEQCPLCGAAVDFRRVVTTRGEHFTNERVVHCVRCGLVFLNPRLSPEGLAQFYLEDTFSDNYRGAAIPDEEALRHRDQRAAGRLEHLRNFLRPQSRILEIGCSCGSFLRVLSDEGFKVCGIDPSTGYAEHAKSRGLDVYVGQFPQDLPEFPPFDAIALFHVIEHVHSPRETLTAIRELLTDDGRLLIEYPDVEIALERPVLRSRYFQKWHLRDFSEASMAVLLRQTGFSVVHTVPGTEYPYEKNMLLVVKKAEPVAQPKLRSESLNDQVYRQLVHKVRKSARADAWKKIRRSSKKLLRRVIGRKAA